MNRLHPKKLLHSKWTAVQPERKQKHFAVVEVSYDEDGKVTHCELEAVINQQRYVIDWRSLKDPSQWRSGWQ